MSSPQGWRPGPPQRPQHGQPQAWQPAPSYPPQGWQPAPAPQAPEPPRTAVTKERKRTSHGLHLFLTIVTGGVWGLLVWLPITLWHKMGPRRKTTTRYR